MATKQDVTACMQNRELSWLDFNLRVLEEAERKDNPLLERFKFAAIFTNNLEEFFRVRVGSMCDRILVAPESRESKTGLTPAEELSAVLKKCRFLCRRRDRAVEEIEKLLSQGALHRLGAANLGANELKRVQKDFERSIGPVLSPQIIDMRHPFPHIQSGQLHLAVLLDRKGKGRKTLGVIPLPPSLSRIWPIEGDTVRYLLLEDILYVCCQKVFGGFEIVDKMVFSVTRSADIDPDEWLPDEGEEEEDFRQHMKKVLKKRARLSPVQLLVSGVPKGELASMLLERLNLPAQHCFSSRVPLNLGYAFSLGKMFLEDSEKKRQWLFSPHTPIEPPWGRDGMMKTVNKRDVLLSYPFESMRPLLTLIREAGADRAVLSIKITLYRIAPFSELAAVLIAAAENGKEVLVLIELRARFDEENNIQWAKKLEEAGCRVIYGPDGLKAHAKLCLITRSERGGVRYITQVGTGNYNENTAKLYTDLCLITADQEIGKDAAHAFLTLSLGSVEGGYQALWVAPREFSGNILRQMDEEIQKARENRRGRIILKCNSLTDRQIIEKLIEASGAGVQIALIIRGICCIRAQVPGLTENITHISIVGRFLEHSRIYAFGEGREQRMFLSSGDLMTRSTTRRVEIACPVRDEAIRTRITEMLDIMLHDNLRAREQEPNGQYRLRTPGENSLPLDSQEYQCRQAALTNEQDKSDTMLGRLMEKIGWRGKR